MILTTAFWRQNFILLSIMKSIYNIAPDSKDLDETDLNSVIFNKKYSYILLRFPLNYAKYNVEFGTREKNQKLISDSTQHINIFQPAQLPLKITLMAFNAHPGYKPSQILRFWNGAHTGPNGQRHGLKFLIRCCRSNTNSSNVAGYKYTFRFSSVRIS